MDTSLQVPDDFNATAFIVDENVSRLKNDKVAIYYQDQKISYKDLQREINKVGNGLKRLGIEIENRIAILLHDCPDNSGLNGFNNTSELTPYKIVIHTWISEV